VNKTHVSFEGIVIKQLIILTPSMSVLLAACSDTTAPPPGGDACAQVRNGVDRALCAEFASIDHQPLIASSDELCTRLSVDMLGRKPTPTERENCAAMDVVDVVTVYQNLDAYRKTQRRRWADRFGYADALVDPYAIKDLDALVDQLYRGESKYSDFATVALSHPAFVGRFISFGFPEEVAKAAFRIFLGRVATRPEASDLAPLWSAWIAGGAFRAQDPEGFTYGPIPYVDLVACEKDRRSCSSTLLGRATIELEPNGRTAIPTAELTEQDWEQLRAPGRLFTSLDIFWESAVDEALEYYLGYDLGTLRPEVRDALVREFRQHQNIVELERAVLTSVAYVQSAREDADHPVPDAIKDLPLAHGPSKLMIPEAWLHSVGTAISTDVGDCDFRYPALSTTLYDAITFQPFDPTDLEDFWPRKTDGTIDRTFSDMASAMGGCPGRFDFFSFTVTTRSNYLGLIAAVGQEEAALSLCLDSPAATLLPSDVSKTDASADSIRKTVGHVFTRLFGGATEEEIGETTDRALAGCAGCNAEQVARQLCSGVSAGVEYIFN
jgi:hypothetical protein